MKSFYAACKLFLIALIFPVLAFGFAMQSAKIDASATNIPAAYDHADAASLVLTGTRGKKHLIAINETSDRIAINADAADKDLVPNADERDIYLPAGGTVAIDDLSMGNRVYLRSDSGAAITADKVFIFVW